MIDQVKDYVSDLMNRDTSSKKALKKYLELLPTFNSILNMRDSKELRDTFMEYNKKYLTDDKENDEKRTYVDTGSFGVNVRFSSTFYDGADSIEDSFTFFSVNCGVSSGSNDVYGRLLKVHSIEGKLIEEAHPFKYTEGKYIDQGRNELLDLKDFNLPLFNDNIEKLQVTYEAGGRPDRYKIGGHYDETQLIDYYNLNHKLLNKPKINTYDFDGTSTIFTVISNNNPIVQISHTCFVDYRDGVVSTRPKLGIDLYYNYSGDYEIEYKNKAN